MASITKRGKYWRAQIRRRGYPTQFRTFDTKALAEACPFCIDDLIERYFVKREAWAEYRALDGCDGEAMAARSSPGWPFRIHTTLTDCLSDVRTDETHGFRVAHA